jgi:hypothetical protein
MNGFLTSDFNRTGGAGNKTDIGGKELGAFRAINLEHNNRDSNSDNKGSSNISSGSLRREFRDKDRRKEFSANRDNLRGEASTSASRVRGLEAREDTGKNETSGENNSLFGVVHSLICDVLWGGPGFSWWLGWW